MGKDPKHLASCILKELGNEGKVAWIERLFSKETHLSYCDGNGRLSLDLV